nr:hypothetical protein L204_01959 [Cryptococcus depauperatus CBS 7855]
MAEVTKYGNATEFDVDLHSIYAAYIGLFESTNIDWWDKSWGGFFVCFNDFLGFGWEVMVVVDQVTGKPHIAVRRDQNALFARMIRTRFGETLPKEPPTTLPLNPVPTRNLALRRLVTIRDLSAYKKLAATLPAAELSYLRSRVRAGEPAVIEQLFYAGGSSGERDTGGIGVRDNGVGYTFACIKINWWEKGGSPYGLVPGQGRTQPGKGGQGKGLALEVGTAVLRCPNLRAMGVWPPTPTDNYRKSHYVVEEWVDKRTNHSPPTFPRAYAFGQSEFVSEKRVETILDATLNALASQEIDNQANTLILLTVGEPAPYPLPNSSTLPNNILIFDVLAFEYNLLRRAQAQGIPVAPDRQQPLTNLPALLQTLQIPVPAFAPIGNAGNDAYYTLLAFQKLVMGETRLPDLLFSQPNNSFPSMPFVHTSHGAMPFPSYSPATVMSMPIPIMPVAVQGRRESRTFARGSDNGSFPSSPADGRSQGRRYGSDNSRQRPASVGDPFNVGTSTFTRSSSENRSPLDHAQGSVSSAELRPKTFARSQTVFWDNAAYADNQPTQGMRDSVPKAPLRGDMNCVSLGSSPNPRSRLREGPPLSRSAAVSGKLGTQCRSISFDGNGTDGGLNSLGGGSKGILGPTSASNSPANGPTRIHAVDGNSTGINPSGFSSTSLSQDRADRADSSGTGSTTMTKPSFGSSNEIAAMGSGTLRKGRLSTGSAQVVEDEKKTKAVKEKKKAKGPKEFAGAIAKFWVG